MRESSGGVVYERERKDMEDVTVVVLTRCDVCTRIVEVVPDNHCPTGVYLITVLL